MDDEHREVHYLCWRGNQGKRAVMVMVLKSTRQLPANLSNCRVGSGDGLPASSSATSCSKRSFSAAWKSNASQTVALAHCLILAARRGATLGAILLLGKAAKAQMLDSTAAAGKLVWQARELQRHGAHLCAKDALVLDCGGYEMEQVFFDLHHVLRSLQMAHRLEGQSGVCNILAETPLQTRCLYAHNILPSSRTSADSTATAGGWLRAKACCLRAALHLLSWTC